MAYIPSVIAHQPDPLTHSSFWIMKSKILEPTDHSEREEDEFYKHGHFNEDRFYDRDN